MCIPVAGDDADRGLRDLYRRDEVLEDIRVDLRRGTTREAGDIDVRKKGSRGVWRGDGDKLKEGLSNQNLEGRRRKHGIRQQGG